MFGILKGFDAEPVISVFFIMNYLKYILYIIGIAFIGFVIWLFFAWLQEKGNAERWENNANQKDSIYKETQLTPKEFKDHYSYLIDSIYKIFDLKIKPKQVNNYTTINNSYSTDSSKTYHITPSGGLYPINYNNDCFSYSGLFNSQDSTYKHIIGNYDSKITILEFWERPILFLKIRNPFKKEYFRQVINPCDNSAKIERIEITKN